MTNIILTQKCNLKCTYCFANEFVNKETSEISFENFITAFNFIISSKKDQIGLIGGEPTLHPYFKEILEYILKIRKTNKFKNRIILYTNGIMVEPYINLLKELNSWVLVNCNAPEIIGKPNYDKLTDNIIKLHKALKYHSNLGINLFNKEMNTDFIFDLLKITKSKYLRISLTVPNCSVNFEPISYYKDNKEFIISFIKKCFENNILPSFDCNSIPQCIFSNKEKDFLFDFKKYYKKSLFTIKPPFNLISYPKCFPVIDIFPDLTAVRCFGTSKYMRIPIKDFDSSLHIKKYFQAEIDRYADLLPASKQCQDCIRKKSLECTGGCLVYKLPDIIELKKIYKEFIDKKLK